jgi:Tfp pilus assembly protein PilW
MTEAIGEPSRIEPYSSRSLPGSRERSRGDAADMGNRGLTLVELVLGLGLASIILLAVSAVYVFATRTGIENDSQAYLQRQAALIIDEMGRRIRVATTVGATPALAITTCSGVSDSLQVTQSDGTVYCFRRDSASAGISLIRDHCPPDAGGNPQPNCASPDTWPLLSGAPATLTTTNGPTVVGGVCGSGAGFCPGQTGLAPALTNGGKSVTVTLQLRYRIPESPAFQAMTFTTDISTRN